MTRDGAPLRVAIFGNFLSAWLGGRSVCEDLAEYLEHRGVQVVRASSRRSALGRFSDILTTAIAARGRYDVAYVDVFAGRAFVWAEAVSSILGWFGKPYVLALRGGTLPDFARRHPRRMRRLLNGARLVVAPSRYLAERLAGYRDDVVILPNAVDVAAYRGRVRAGVKPRLVWLRRFHATYDPSLAVQVFARVAQTYPDATLVMAGPDSDGGVTRAAALAEARRLGVERGVEIRGNVEKAAIPDLFEGNDIYINTPVIDNTPVTVIEAMASGLCIVSTDVGGISAICTDGGNALLVPSRDAEAMARACIRLVESPELARALSETALAGARQYDRDALFNRWKDLLWSATTQV